MKRLTGKQGFCCPFNFVKIGDTTNVPYKPCFHLIGHVTVFNLTETFFHFPSDFIGFY